MNRSDPITPRLGPRKQVYSNPIQTIYKVAADFGNFEKTYYVDDHKERVGVVVPQGSKILLVRQYRFLVNRESLEIPGGRIDAGETPSQAALRECREEAAVDVEGVEPLIGYLPGMDVMNNPTQIFLARSVRQQLDFRPDPREVTERLWMPLDRCLEKIFSGEIRCGLTIVGLLAYYHSLTMRT